MQAPHNNNKKHFMQKIIFHTTGGLQLSMDLTTTFYQAKNLPY